MLPCIGGRFGNFEWAYEILTIGSNTSPVLEAVSGIFNPPFTLVCALMDGTRQLEYRQNQRSDDQSDHDPHYKQHDRFDDFGQSGDALVEFAHAILGRARHDLALNVEVPDYGRAQLEGTA